ncbi:hypothetical protein [Winogradskyella immobilis]|uniref:Uncharacterized protein n=1 Tax=Winogradskyella immobilis TaxID=2816852 RepID=A0ABS8EMB2_9FLAO|nr:hypothetical protein [Winogradskyella immobilis]MCC1484349.1 hypothetical protein [Winogradskyella immobilis]MCG0016441.1 hypothetical protein [Winogradskyella immobilis]
MKLLIWVTFLIAFLLILMGFFLDLLYSKKLIGFGVVTLFFIVFPLFSYYRWKDKDPKDYMLTKENLDKMRESQKQKKH